MLKCLIIDDDPLITDLIQHYCSKVPEIEYCISCNNPLDGLRLLSNQSFDLLFLDYNMPDLDGKGVLELKQDDSKVVMITSHPDFAVDSYNYPDVVDYLLKPISFERFYKALEKPPGSPLNVSGEQNPKGETTKSEKETFFVKDGVKWIQVQIRDLLYIKSESNYVILHKKDKQIMSLMNLKDLDKDLPDNFIRVHRSYIVNTHFIDYLTTDELSINGKLIPVGAKYKTALKELVKKG
ncbi:MAG: response regulator transcription factor [Bacteroidetes bacterium]|nr:response regulator transcription factor [Bacteroidota bacterium]